MVSPLLASAYVDPRAMALTYRHGAVVATEEAHFLFPCGRNRISLPIHLGLLVIAIMRVCLVRNRRDVSLHTGARRQSPATPEYVRTDHSLMMSAAEIRSSTPVVSGVRPDYAPGRHFLHIAGLPLDLLRVKKSAWYGNQGRNLRMLSYWTVPLERDT